MTFTRFNLSLDTILMIATILVAIVFGVIFNTMGISGLERLFDTQIFGLLWVYTVVLPITNHYNASDLELSTQEAAVNSTDQS